MRTSQPQGRIADWHKIRAYQDNASTIARDSDYSMLNNVRAIITSAKLIAVGKSADPATTNIQPIAVGEALRRFAGKVQMVQEKAHLK